MKHVPSDCATVTLDEVRVLITDQVPVWPFSTGSLRKFFGLTLSPLVPAAISIIIDRIQELLVGFLH